MQYATPDMEVQWITGEKVAEGAIAVNPDGLNSEPFWAYQWNIRLIHAGDDARFGLIGGRSDKNQKRGLYLACRKRSGRAHQ